MKYHPVQPLNHSGEEISRFPKAVKAGTQSPFPFSAHSISPSMVNWVGIECPSNWNMISHLFFSLEDLFYLGPFKIVNLGSIIYITFATCVSILFLLLGSIYLSVNIIWLRKRKRETAFVCTLSSPIFKYKSNKNGNMVEKRDPVLNTEFHAYSLVSCRQFLYVIVFNIKKN